ncbi:hypothetical protein PENTCL1PPCAC_10669, partial [Pristionchus entomophagus]
LDILSLITPWLMVKIRMLLISFFSSLHSSLDVHHVRVLGRRPQSHRQRHGRVRLRHLMLRFFHITVDGCCLLFLRFLLLLLILLALLALRLTLLSSLLPLLSLLILGTVVLRARLGRFRL